VTPTSQKSLVLVGATGVVGGYALRCALDDDSVKAVTAIERRRLGISHPKLREVLHGDFGNCSTLSSALSRQDAVVFCLGTYTGAVSHAELRKITVDYTIEFARVLRGASPEAAFSFLSRNGADPTGKSRIAFARYKGEAENALIAAGFPSVYLFRPPISIQSSHARNRISPTAFCARSTLRFACFSPISWFELTSWRRLWWTLLSEELSAEAAFSTTAISEPWSKGFIPPQDHPSLRAAEQSELGALDA